MNNDECEFHPFANLFPMMEGQQWEDFKKDVEKNGVADKIIMYEGKILDGRNRYKAATELDVHCESETYKGDDALAFVVSHNLHRRQLTDKQRVEIAAKISTMSEGRPKKTPPNGGVKQTSTKQAADLMNVSQRSVEREKKKQREAASEVPAKPKDKTPKPEKKKPKFKPHFFTTPDTGEVLFNEGNEVFNLDSDFPGEIGIYNKDSGILYFPNTWLLRNFPETVEAYKGIDRQVRELFKSEEVDNG